MFLPVALVIALAWGAFAFGGVYPWAYVPLGLASVLIGASGFLPQPGIALPRLNRALTAGVVLVAIAVALQLVPLPHEALVRLSPGTDAFLQRYNLQYAALVQSETLLKRPASGVRSPASADESPGAGVPPSRSSMGGASADRPESGVAAASGRAAPAEAHPISIDPPETLAALALMAPLAILLLGLTRGLTSRQVRRLAPALVAVGVVLALVGIVQQAGFNGKIYGFWVPEAGLRQAGPGSSAFGPYVNRNHFAGWMLMGIPLGLGYLCALVARAMRGVKPGFRNRFIWLSSREASQVILMATAVVVMAIALVMSLSRSGMASFAVALALFGLLVARRQPGGSRRTVVSAYVVFVAVLAVGWAGLDTVAGRFTYAGRDLAQREAVWQDAIRVYRDFPVFGSGTGTFSTAMLVYQTADPSVHFAQAHNDYLQLLSEGGLLLAIPAGVLVVLFAREVRRRFLHDSSESTTWWIRAGAVVGLVAIGLQEIVEFSLQMPGNAALFVTLVAIAAGTLPHRRTATLLANPAARN